MCLTTTELKNTSLVKLHYSNNYNSSVRAYFDEVKEWLKTLSTHNSKLVGVGSEIMSTKQVPQLLKDLAEYRVSVRF